MDLLQGLQEQMAAMQAQLTVHQAQQKKTADTLEHSRIPEIASTHRPVPFHGYDSEDVNRWLDKLEYYLKLRRIDVRSPTALAELVLNLAGPAEDFFYSLPDDYKTTFGQLRNALKERFSNDNQSWITWQAVTTRQQGELEPLDAYLTDLTKNFRRLNITDAEKMRYFVQGLRSEIRKAVLMKQPKSFREAEQMARLACSVENTMNSSREGSIAAQLGNLSQTVKSLMMTGTNPNAQPLKEDKKLMEMMEQNNAVLADLSASINKLGKPTVEPKVRFAPQNAVNQTSIAALSSPHNERSEINELKEFLLEKIQSLDRQFDARIRGLLRRNQGQRDEIPRERTRDGRPTCLTCGRTGHLQASCPERRNAAIRSQAPQSRQRGVNYSVNPGYNQPCDNYRSFPQQSRRDQRVAMLDEGLYDDEFVAPFQRDPPVIAALPKQIATRVQKNTKRNPGLQQTVPETLASAQVQIKQRKPNQHRKKSRAINQPRNTEADIKVSDLTTEGQIEGTIVQLLVDTGACVSAIDEQFLKNIYGEFSLKISDGC